jgi:hypothetical protein
MDIDEARAALSTLVKKAANRLRPNPPDYLLTFPGGFDEG